MTQNADTLRLRAGGQDYEGWLSVQVERSLEDCPGRFALTVTESAPRANNPIRLMPEDACEIRIGDELVLSGYVEEIEDARDAASRSISVQGRSTVRDVVKNSIITTPPQFKNQTLRQIAEALCAPYGVEVRDLAGLSERIRRFAVETGETPYSAIERIARDQSVLVYDDAQGRLVLGRGYTEDGPAITQELPTAYSLSLSSVDRYAEYRVLGSRVVDDADDVSAGFGVSGTVLDPDQPRRSVLVINAERSMTPASAEARATWEAVYRAARSARVSATIPGWLSPNGRVWAPGWLCPVYLPAIRVNASLVVVSVSLGLDDGGRSATLELLPPGAFEPIPPVERIRRKRKPITEGVGPAKGSGADTTWEELRGGV